MEKELFNKVGKETIQKGVKNMSLVLGIQLYVVKAERKLNELKANGMSEECIVYLRSFYKKELESFIKEQLESEQNA